MNPKYSTKALEATKTIIEKWKPISEFLQKKNERQLYILNNQDTILHIFIPGVMSDKEVQTVRKQLKSEFKPFEIKVVNYYKQSTKIPYPTTLLAIEEK